MLTGIPKNGINKGQFKKGHIPWDKGIKRPPFSKECIQKMKIAGSKKKLSKEQKDKMKKSAVERWKNPILRKKQSQRNKGKKGSGWRGGITPKNILIRSGIEYRLWRESVFARDNWTCQRYHIKGGRLHPHHIKNFSQYPELRFAIDNGITLSEKAHKEFHKEYGIRNNTKEQLEEFLAH